MEMVVEQTESPFLNQFQVGNESVEGRTPWRHWLLVTMCLLAIVVGVSIENLLSRFYFTQGGHSLWLRSLMAFVGWPLLLVPLFLQPPTRSSLHALFDAKFVVALGFLGVLAAGMELLFSIGLSFLPLSTYSLITATPLAFNSVFSFILLKRRISPYALNSVVLLILSVIILGISNDKVPRNKQSPLHFGLSLYTFRFCCGCTASSTNATRVPKGWEKRKFHYCCDISSNNVFGGILGLDSGTA